MGMTNNVNETFPFFKINESASYTFEHKVPQPLIITLMIPKLSDFRANEAERRK